MQYNNNNDGNIKNDGVYNNNDDNDDNDDDDDDDDDEKILHWINFIHQTFPAHYDYDKISIFAIDPPIKTRFLRINPNAWIQQNKMKFDLYGCILDNVTTKSPLGKSIITVFLMLETYVAFTAKHVLLNQF